LDKVRLLSSLSILVDEILIRNLKDDLIFENFAGGFDASVIFPPQEGYCSLLYLELFA
jgi:hypothetical protein